MSDYEENKTYIASISDLKNLGYEVMCFKEGTLFAFQRSAEGVFISANPDRTISEQTHCFNWETFRLKEEYTPFHVIRFPESRDIPKLIHQTDESNTPRAQFEDNIRELKEKNTDFLYNYYNPKARHDFIYENFGWDALEIYLKINRRYGAARADLFRYFCIYKYGGIYLDMKSGCDVPFQEILGDDNRMILSHWASSRADRHWAWGFSDETNYLPKGEYLQWFIISRAGNPLMRKVINQVLSNVELYDHSLNGVGQNATLRVTGPIPFTRIISSYETNSNVRHIDSGSVGLSFYNVSNYTRMTHYVGEKTPLVL